MINLFKHLRGHFLTFKQHNGVNSPNIFIQHAIIINKSRNRADGVSCVSFCLLSKRKSRKSHFFRTDVLNETKSILRCIG